MLRPSLVFLAFVSAGATTPCHAICPELLEQLGEEDVFHPQPHMRQAAEDVIRARLAAATLPESLGAIPNRSDCGDCTVTNFHDRLKVETVVKPGTPSRAVADHVYEIQTPSGKQYFRPLNLGLTAPEGPQRARKTLAAHRVNRRLRLKVFPKTKWAMFEGKVGSLSEAAEGKEPERTLEALQAAGLANAASVSNTIAFEFLIGDFDGRKENMRVDTAGNVQVYDPDHAFTHGLVNFKAAEPLLAGAHLPEKYTPEFVKALRTLDIGKMRRDLEYLLSEAEIEGIVFRREIILRDLERRGASAVWP